MKKIILSIAVSAALLISVNTFAADTNPGITVSKAFSKEFSQVKDVSWTTLSTDGIYQATFLFNNENLQAFFTQEGEYLGTTRQVKKAQLPIAVVTALDKQYANFLTATIFEYSKTDGLSYYITLVNSKGAMVVKANGNGELSVYKKNVQ